MEPFHINPPDASPFSKARPKQTLRPPCHRSERSEAAQELRKAGEIGGMAANVGAGRSSGGVGGGAGDTGTAAAGSGSVATTAVCRPSGSRWTPTPEQIRILKELYYGCGIRSPNSEQIQRITAMLRQHGKIEGKNVFYWFQNHKARERQKRRLTNLDVNVPAAAANAADASSTHLGVLSLSSPSGAAPPSPTLGFYAGNGGGGGNSAVLLDTSSDWGSSAATAMATETCFLQDYMGVMGTGSAAAASPWACFSSSDPRAASASAPTVTRAPETLPLFPTGYGDSRHLPRPRHEVPAGGTIRGGSSSSYLPFWGAASTTATPTASATSVAIQHQQQHHQLLQLQEQYSFYSNTTQLPLPGTGGSQDASAAAAASLELSLSSPWCSPYPAGTM